VSIRRGVIYFYVVLVTGVAFTSSLALVKGPPRVFGALLTLSLLLLGTAFATRRIGWLCALSACLAVLVASVVADEWCYLRWTRESQKMVDSLTESMRQSNPQYVVGRIPISPSAYFVKPQQQLLLHFEPPLVAWTYHLSKLSVARPSVDALFSALRTLFWSPASSGEIDELVSMHTAWNIGVMRCHVIAACRGGSLNDWVIYAHHGRGI